MKKNQVLLALLCILIGSRTLVAQNLYVGSNSPGSTNFTSGTTGFSNIYVGFTANASNSTLGIFNTNTTLIASNNLQVGVDGSFNTMVVSNGGVMNSSFALTSIGKNSDSSNNSVLVTGPGSRWTNGGNAFIGNAGSANSLIVSNGGVAGFSGLVYIGGSTNSSNNSILVTGTNSQLIGYLSLGYIGASNSLVISNGAHVTGNGNAGIGVNSTASNNSVLITGSNSIWNIGSGYFYVGAASSFNSMTISNGGMLTNGSGFIGESGSSNNTVTVTGSSSSWVNSGSFYVGDQGSSNTLIISSGATVSDTNGAIGYTNSINNLVTVTGTNSTWSNSTNNLYIGGFGTSYSNTMIVSNGATVSDGNGYIGNSTNCSNNSVVVTGSNSIWSNSSTLEVGNYGSSNSLVISNGGLVYSGLAYLGANGSNSSNNTVLVTGTNSTWLSGNIQIGYNGSGNSVIVSNGAHVTNTADSLLGATAASFNNSLLITGSNSVWNNGGDFHVGYNGAGNMLAVSNAGLMISASGHIGYNNGANNNSVIITGSNSMWSNSGNLYVGDVSYGNTMVVSNGGSVIAQTGYIGNNTYASNNVVIVTGTGSTWINTADLYVGYYGSSNTLIVSNGGTVIDQSGYLDSVFSSSNTAIITGVGSVWSNAATLTLGDDGVSNTVTVANGATLAASNIIIANQSGGEGTLNIGSYGGSDAAGSLVAASVAFGDGTGTINFNQTNTLTLTSAISGSGTLQQLGSGMTILSGSNSYTGFITVSTGTLVGASANPFGVSTLSLSGGNVTISNAMTMNILDWESNNSVITSATPGTSVLNATGSVTTTSQTNYWGLGTIDNNTNLILTTVTTNDFLNTLKINGITNATITKETVGGTNFYYSYVPGGSDIVVTGTETIASNTTVGNVSFSNNSTLVIATNGTLNVTNNYTSTNSGTLEYYFTTPNASPRIIVGNTATLGGNLVVHYANGTHDGDVNQLMTAGTITGKFSNITGDNPSRYSYFGTCVGDPGYYIVTAPASYTLVAVNQNQVNVASALNSFRSGTGDYLTVSTDLNYLTDPQYPNVFNQISPQLYTTLATVAFNSAVAQYNEMVQRLGNIRVAGVGFSSMGMDNSPIIDDSKNPKSNGKDLLIPAVDNHWGFFVDGNGIFANVNINNQLPGYSAEGGGVTIGSDYKWNNEFSTGLYVGYEGFQSKQSGGNYVSDNGSRFGAFGTYQHGGLFVNGILGGDSHSYQVYRNIQFQGPSSIAPALNRTASSAPTAGELDSMLAAGYDVKRDNFTFGPITSLQYTYFGLQPFTENGAQALDLSVQNANDNSMVYSLGSHCFYTWQVNRDVLVVPQINLGWQHEFLQNPYALNASFGNGANFAYNSTTPLRDSLYTGIGFTVNLNKKYDASFFYNASACNPSIMSQNFFVSLGTRF